MTWLFLKLAYGLFFIAAGADKFFSILTNWSKYVSPSVLALLHTTPETLIPLIGCVEIAIGVLILTFATHFGAWLGALWMLIVVGNLLSLGHYGFSPELIIHNPYLDIIVRDVMIAIGILALASLTTIRKHIE